MEINHLIDLLSKLTPDSKFKYVRGEDFCTFVRIDKDEQRLYTKTPLNENFSFAKSYISELAEKIKENVPFNTSQLLNNKGSNRAVIDSIIAHTSEFYWLQRDRSRYTVWIPSHPHEPGKLIELTDMSILYNRGDSKGILDKNYPHQQIFYGAPGTGKSHKIKDDLNVKAADAKNLVFRITFHPDSDYSTFVGAYKPSMEKNKSKVKVILDYDSLVDKLKEYLDLSKDNLMRAFTFFGYDYHDSLVEMQDETSHSVRSLVADAYKSGTTYDTQVRVGMNLYEQQADKKDETSKIVYQFVPQVFTKAYTTAWNTEDNVFLIIEEINRGNCAQIFGDLFQLLDRKDGMSEYPIDADSDLADYIEGALKDSPRTDIPKEVKYGSKLMLPKNLYIWATMNTSDQSLFPMDSAFKRRWEWKYIKIADAHKDWAIETNGQDWYGFIQQINLIISNMTASADKQLGYFFCQANKDKKISTETFVSKVIFYLWNDVFKDYGFDDASLFKYKTLEGDKEIEKDLTFPDFYDEDGNVVEDVVRQFIEHVMAWGKDKKKDNK